jgi:spermidine/putrescine ABC transporter ATP-binding subunit
MDGSAAAVIGYNQGAAVGLTNLEKRFDSVGAVRGVTIDVRSGEFLTLLGPSGSGKTTTLMMIAGFEKPSAGDITIDGQSVVALPAHRRNIGMVFQSYALFPHMTVAENIGFPLKQRGTGKATRACLTAEALEIVRLPGYEARYPRQLSGGQQQRVALARAIVFRPRLLLMDEPLGALDKQLRESLQLEMRRLHAELGITFIYVTHDQEEALTMSDRVAVMNHGLVEQIGSPEDLYDRPANHFVASFIGESNFLPGIVRGTEHGMAIVSHGNAVLRAVTGTTRTNGDAVTLVTRPERLRFVDDGPVPFGWNSLPVKVTETVFTGERCRTVCQGVGGVPIVVKSPSGAMTRRRVAGETAEIAWPCADTVLV